MNISDSNATVSPFSNIGLLDVFEVDDLLYDSQIEPKCEGDGWPPPKSSWVFKKSDAATNFKIDKWIKNRWGYGKSRVRIIRCKNAIY